MKNIIYNCFLLVITITTLSSCSDYIDLENKNEIAQDDFFRDETEFNLALNGCYSSLRGPVTHEWMLTEIRSDNTFMNNYGTTNSQNLQILSNDIFEAPSFDLIIENYWKTTYQSIRSINILQNALKTSYDETNGNINFNNGSLPISEPVRKRISGEASFMRAYHYFNLVRLFGKTFLIDRVVTPEEALTLNRATVNDVYKFIIADLKHASTNCSASTFSGTPAVDKGRATAWAAKALLAKVYLTRGQKSEALTLLNDVITNSGYSLLTGTSGYANVFSANNEVNAELLFAIRYKSGGLGYGSSLSNLFSTNTTSVAVQTGLILPAGNRGSFNNPTEELYNSYATNDIRRNFNIKVYKPNPFSAPTTWTYWAAKHNSASAVANDSELDWPVLRYSDVLLMYCEADGTPNTTTLGYLNRVHTRAGLTAVNPTTIPAFEKAVADERRWEFALENQRWFDLLRFNTTMTSITAENVMINHFTAMEPFYAQYNDPLTATQLQTKVTVPNDKFKLLPIPNFEIITNTINPIEQNSGY